MMTVMLQSRKLTQGLRLGHHCKPLRHLCYMSFRPRERRPAAANGLETCQVASMRQTSGRTLMAPTERPSQTTLTYRLPQTMMPIPTFVPLVRLYSPALALVLDLALALAFALARALALSLVLSLALARTNY